MQFTPVVPIFFLAGSSENYYFEQTVRLDMLRMTVKLAENITKMEGIITKSKCNPPPTRTYQTPQSKLHCWYASNPKMVYFCILLMH